MHKKHTHIPEDDIQYQQINAWLVCVCLNVDVWLICINVNEFTHTHLAIDCCSDFISMQLFK